MAINSGQFDLNCDAVLFDGENEVLGFNPLGFNVNVGASHSETLTGGEGLVPDYKLVHGGDDEGGVNDAVEPLSRVVSGEFRVDNGCKKEGFGKVANLVDRGNGLEVVDVRGCDGKTGEISCGFVKNEDDKSMNESSGGPLFVYGGAETWKGLVFEGNVGVRNELECAENSLLGTNASSKNEAHGVYNNLSEGKKMKNAALVDLSETVEDGNQIKAAESLVTKDALEDSQALEITTYQLQNGIQFMDVMNVNAKTESLHLEDSFTRNHLGLETSDELKQPAFQADAQVAMMQTGTSDFTVAGAELFQNTQNEYRGLNLIVDFNSYRKLLEGDLCSESMCSEVNFCVSDLVWGKVMGHPWWPGQVFDPSAASEKAKRHLKKDSYLIAYFGDRTFAWNDLSSIKPFQMHFSQMVKQSSLESFHHAVGCALDEVSRRVEFGLSCPCISEDVFSKVKTQVTINAGIQKESSRRNGGDRFINAMSFEPKNLFNYVKSLAQSPLVESDRLDFAIVRAQLSAFYRSKGYSELPEFPLLGGLLDYDMEILLMGEKEQRDNQIDGQQLKIHLGFPEKPKRGRGRPRKKLKLVTDLMSEKSLCVLNGEYAMERKAKNESISGSSIRKRKAAYNTSDDYFHDPPKRKLAELKYVSVDDIWSKLCVAATNPMGERCLSDMVYFFSEVRNFISLGDSASMEQEMSLEQMHAGENGVTPIEAVAHMTYAMEPCNDSYWTDRIVQSISEEQPVSKNQNEGEKLLPETRIESCSHPFKSPPAGEISINLDFTEQVTDRNLGPGPSKVAEHLAESSTQDFSPTALSLKFTDLDSIPSTENLNKIFGRFGPLIESKTELLTKTKRAKVVFKRRSDAETAFSSAGKYSTFGPALVSYRLKILPRIPEKVKGKRGRKSREEKSSLDGAAV
ncbi:hypothetical protein TanjilG_22667 [Lupinus angustifolius]|uniref:PWWP domain-containing protein n=2 Tax=Lupinus angustifolius TaxID=3871 RepID=A0A1J7GM74_LUPAN|nr:hypothetical protein TanjilG_22667 [Lupinus angustifolius]